MQAGCGKVDPPNDIYRDMILAEPPNLGVLESLSGVGFISCEKHRNFMHF